MIKVLKAGFYATIQDKGRVGFANIGVPVSGVMDSYAADIANSILDNSIEDAVLEITFGGAEFLFLEETFIAISGADFSATINHQLVKLNSRIPVSKDDVLSFGKIHFGVRSYLAVQGGFQTLKVIESRSQYKNITPNFRIQKNAILPVEKCIRNLEIANTSIKINKTHFTSKEIFCTKGPEFYLLNTDQKAQIFNQLFTISKDNNRMGYRLNETVKNDFPSILTSAVLPGTVQLTPSGKLMLLMRDCQVTGGYPRILQLTESAVNRIAQKTTNQSIKFILSGI